MKKCVVGTLYTLTAYNKDKVPMDVAASLVVNHINLGALYLYVVFMFMIMFSTIMR